MNARKTKLSDNLCKNALMRGNAFFCKGLFDEAIASFREAIGLNPYNHMANHNLGVALHRAGQYEDALVSFKRVLAINNTIYQAWIEGGNTLCCMERDYDAIAWYEEALRISPESKEAHYNLANALKKVENYHDATIHYHKALSIDSSMPEAHNNLGTLLMHANQLDKARSCFMNAIELRPAYPQAYYNLGLVYESEANISASLDSVRKALNITPDYGEALSLMVSLLQQTCSWESLAHVRKRLYHITKLQLISQQRPSESPFLSFCLDADSYRNFTIASAWSRTIKIHEGQIYRGYNHLRVSTKKKRLTIGYLSEQFRNAATAHLTAGLFALHDRNRFKVVAYSWGRDDNSYYRRKIMSDVDEFVDLRDCSDDVAAHRIYNDNVTILVDLMGWMKGHRIGILARRPAPVQVNYLGYPGTTGTSFMDYILADKVVIPPDEKQCYSEKVVYLPGCYLINDPDPPLNSTLVTREDYGLPKEGVVFCSFSTDYKIEARVFDIWMNILAAIHQSVLWLLVRSREGRENLRRAAESRKIDPRRLIFAEPLPKDKHLARLTLADLALDTFTVNGHTTATDTLWAGVPLIARKGTHFASRVAASILYANGLPELVVNNEQDYQRLAIRLASAPPHLDMLKRKLNEQKRTQPLYSIQHSVRHLENAYTVMWQRFMNCLPPESFDISYIS